MNDDLTSPAFPLRGVKGLWWEPEQYRGWPKLLAETGYNLLMLCYTFSREAGLHWRRPLRESDRDIIRELADECRAHGITLCLALHPLIGGHAWDPAGAALRYHPTIGPNWFVDNWQERLPGEDVTPDPPIRFGSHEDLALLVEKCRDAASLGVASFALCLDDIDPSGPPEGFADLASAHLWLVRGLHDAPVPGLFAVPTYYWTEGARAHPEYTAALADGLPADVGLFWTGSVVRDHAISGAKARQAAELFGRRPVVWLNYASNDSFRFQAQMPPDLPPTADLAGETAGLLLNSSRQVGLAEIDARIIAQYLADPAGYDHERALREAVDAAIGHDGGTMLLLLWELYEAVPDTRTLNRDLVAGGKPFLEDLLERLNDTWLQLTGVGPALAMNMDQPVIRRDLARANRRLRLLMDGLEVLRTELNAAGTTALAPIDPATPPTSAHRQSVELLLDTLDPEVGADARALLLLGPA